MFEVSLPKDVKKLVLEIKNNLKKQEEIICKKYEINYVNEAIKINFYDKKYLCKNCLNEIFRDLAENLKTDIAIDLDSFLVDEKIDLNTIAYIAVTNFNVFTKKPVCLKKIKCTNKKIYYVSKNIDQVNQKELLIIVDAICEARRFQEMPPNLLYPELFAKEVVKLGSKIPNLKIKVLSYSEIVKQKMGLLVGVGQASVNKPSMVVLEYIPNKNGKNLAFVGKGMTFDAGGYNIKISGAMRGMKFDLSGAASVANFVIAAAKLKYEQNIIGICPLAENLINGNGIKSDDVLTSMAGLSVEIVNTDAEGRLIMADALYYAYKNYQPTKITTVATLTGAIGLALGTFYTGAFTQCDDLYHEYEMASKKANEPIWRMPLTNKHRKLLLNSRVADILHCPEGKDARMASSSTAAAFMTMFIKDTPYIHFDIAYTDHINFDQSSGVLIKTFLQLCK